MVTVVLYEPNSPVTFLHDHSVHQSESCCTHLRYNQWKDVSMYQFLNWWGDHESIACGMYCKQTMKNFISKSSWVSDDRKMRWMSVNEEQGNVSHDTTFTFRSVWAELVVSFNHIQENPINTIPIHFERVVSSNIEFVWRLKDICTSWPQIYNSWYHSGQLADFFFSHGLDPHETCQSNLFQKTPSIRHNISWLTHVLDSETVDIQEVELFQHTAFHILQARRTSRASIFSQSNIILIPHNKLAKDRQCLVEGNSTIDIPTELTHLGKIVDDW